MCVGTLLCFGGSECPALERWTHCTALRWQAGTFSDYTEPVTVLIFMTLQIPASRVAHQLDLVPRGGNEGTHANWMFVIRFTG